MKRVPTKSAPPRVKRSPGAVNGAAGAKAGIRIRMYRVGFGDFFLLSVPGADGAPIFVLVDCGVHAVDLKSIDDAIADMAKETNRKLALVIMTHRHADHISGFARGAKQFAHFEVERVWMPWFENPGNKDAVKYQRTLTDVALNLQSAFALRAGAADSDYMRMAQDVTGELGVAGGSTGNQTALNVLHGGFKNQPPIDYYQAGDTPTLPPSLVNAGMTAQILGPPIDPNLIAEMDGKGHQYLATNTDAGAPPKRFNKAFRTTETAYPPEAFGVFSAPQIAQKLASLQPDLAIAKASQVNNTINNQSLVVLFTLRGKNLLFAGDAQWGNWQNFLFGGAFGTAGHNQLTDSAKQILGSIDFYKVGHHGSRNATPIDAVKAMRPDCFAMCSTQPGAYGSAANQSEVPRKPLIAALDQKTQQRLARSDQVSVPGADTAEIKAFEKQNPPGQLPAAFQAGPNGRLYVDLHL